LASFGSMFFTGLKSLFNEIMLYLLLNPK